MLEQRSSILELELATEQRIPSSARSVAEAASALVTELGAKLKDAEAKAEDLSKELAGLTKTHDRVHGKYKSLK